MQAWVYYLWFSVTGGQRPALWEKKLNFTKSSLHPLSPSAYQY